METSEERGRLSFKVIIIMAEMRSTRYDCLLKVLVVGDPYVGKSSLLLQYVDGVVPLTCKSTIGGDFRLKSLHF